MNAAAKVVSLTRAVEDAGVVSEDELAKRFSAVEGTRFKYVPAWGRWLVWDGMRWARDEKRRIFNDVRAVCRRVRDDYLARSDLSDAQQKSLIRSLGAASTVYAVAKLASADARHAVEVKQLDADPWLLNTPGGTLDLRTGEMHAHDPKELHTKVTAATPGGDCPLFRKVLERVLPDESIRSYVQRVCGYGMTGSAREHVLPWGVGGGRNGKGTVIHTFRRALGDYGLEIGAETLMESRNERHPTETAVLHGARFVVASEIDSGRRWNEARLKRLTGGDPISARYIAQDLFEFEPSHTLVLIGNVKPGLRSVDEAMRARLHMVEFNVTIPEEERDPLLPERLVREYGGILAWGLEGCLDWQDGGLKPPAAVRDATARYIEGEDMLQAWINECCERSGQVTLSAAHASYRQWCEGSGAVVMGRNTFGDQLAARGYTRDKESRSGKPVFVGLSLPVVPDGRFAE